MLDWDAIAPMIVAVVLFLTVGAVAVLRPLSKRLADILEMYARDRERGIEGEVRQMRDLLETMSARLELMEERQEFTERLLGPGEEARKKRGERLP